MKVLTPDWDLFPVQIAAMSNFLPHNVLCILVMMPFYAGAEDMAQMVLQVPA